VITVLNLRQHILNVADDLDLPLTVPQAERLADHVAVRLSRGKTPQMVLSDQLQAVLVGLASGETAETTARWMCRSTETVKTHRARLYKVLGARTGAHAVAIATDLGLLHTKQIGARP
jgi:DNA-binding NarL/FixJ family response regulator